MIDRYGLALVVSCLVVLTGCATTTRGMDVYAPDACYGKAEAFSTYALEFVGVPGFIQDPIEKSASGALAAIGLTAAANPGDAGIRVVNTFFLIDRNPPPQAGDPMGEPVQSGSVNRFVAHLKVDVVDQRTATVIWTGSMYRDHAIAGGETFHDDRAVLLIRQAYDKMFVGLTRPCG